MTNRAGKGKLACPWCGCLVSRVTNSRDDAVGTGFWRRRQCQGCLKRFTTEETIRGLYKSSSSSTHHNM